MRSWNVLVLAACASVGSFAVADDLFVPSQYATIQAAVDAASPGDIVHVAAGTYDELVDLQGKAITVRGDSRDTTTVQHTDPDPSSTSESTLFDCTGVPAPGAVIEGFRLKGGRGSVVTSVGYAGGGVLAVDAVVTVRDCAITKGGTPYTLLHGGGIAAVRSTLTVEDVAIGDTGGWYGGGIFGRQSDIHLAGSRVYRCNASFGSAIFADRCTTLIEDSFVLGNGAGPLIGYPDGAVRAVGGTIEIASTQFSDNRQVRTTQPSIYVPQLATSLGVQDCDSLVIRGCQFTDQIAEATLPSVVLEGDTPVVVEDCTFAYRGLATKPFSGLQPWVSVIGGEFRYCDETALALGSREVVIDSVEFRYNTGLCLELLGETVEMRNSRFQYNGGPLLYVSSDDATVENTRFFGGAISTGTDAPLTILGDRIRFLSNTVQNLLVDPFLPVRTVDISGAATDVWDSTFTASAVSRTDIYGQSGSVERCTFAGEHVFNITLPMRDNTVCGGSGYHGNLQLDGGNVFRESCGGCEVDLVRDGVINTLDFFQFMIWYERGLGYERTLWTDFTRDEAIDTNDFFAFLAAYQQGC